MKSVKFKLLPVMLNLLLKTLRFEFINLPLSFDNKIFIFWHCKMIAGWYIFKDKSPVALVSLSKDGEVLNGILKKWNFNVVRGSSSHGGKEALSELINISKAGNPVILTPDGPRGPANEIKNGALIVSKENGFPIIPVNINYSKKKILRKSWDKFEVPLPFAKCTVKFGSEHYYKEFLEGGKLSCFKQGLSDEMNTWN
jgi:lysophospholipid acyltransferase (LPLAT)-like uncharacterized protein